ncbi:MAG TPA: hypothetical protein VFE07_14670 [Marmoricola sp.]|nr:hypothetical protein [Marmoricola sp.]
MDEVQLKPLWAPDPERPDWVFKDGDHAYQVLAMPAGMPLSGIVGNQGVASFFEFVYVLVGSMIADWVEPSWKVVVTRTRLRKPSWYRVVAIEFVGTTEAADERQVEIVRTWVHGRYATTPRLRGGDIRRLRHEHRRATTPDLSALAAGCRKRARRLAALAAGAAALAALLLVDGLDWSVWPIFLPVVLFVIAARGSYDAWREGRSARG